MPNASSELRHLVKLILRTRGPVADSNPCWRFLALRGYIEKDGMIFRNPKGLITEKESLIIDYLIQEWDWSYNPRTFKEVYGECYPPIKE